VFAEVYAWVWKHMRKKEWFNRVQYLAIVNVIRGRREHMSTPTVAFIVSPVTIVRGTVSIHHLTDAVPDVVLPASSASAGSRCK
jgi:hypothetical protein